MEKNQSAPKHKYDFKTYNGRIKVYVDGSLFFSFNQLDYVGCYFFKDDVNLYGCTLYFSREKANASEMDIYFKSKETWLEINKLLDENM
jgi:hypothetical protein